MVIRSGLSGVAAALVLLFAFVCFAPVQSLQAQDKIVVAQSEISEKEAYEAAKELGTIEAWEAFLENFPKGFRADLARAYVKRIGSEDAPAVAETPAPTQTPVAETPPPPPPAPADISLAMTSDGTCTGGRNCSVTVTATNAGGEPFSGNLTIATSLAPGGAELQGTGTPPFSCEGAGGGAICSTGLANIAPGKSATIPLTFRLPRNSGGQVTTCANIAWGGVPSALGPREVQRKLNELGFNAGPADGQPGRKTISAIRAFQQSAGIQETGEIDLPLLLALFAPGGAGDANPANDQACAGAAVTSAPPLPAAYQPPTGPSCPLGQIVASNGTCGCPSSAPFWTGKSCVPRLARNCKGGTYYNKGQKLCLCPSRKPHWYNNRCHAQFDNCPGDSVRVGDKCLKSNDPGFAARPRPNRPQFGGGCSGNSIRIGNVCVNIANAPVFGNKPGRGGGGQNFTGGGRPGNQTFSGGGNRPNRPLGGQAGSGSRLSEAQVRAELLSHCNSLGLDGMRKPGTNQLAFNSCAKSSANMAKQVMSVPRTANISQRQAINGFKGELNGAAAAYQKTIAKQNQQGGPAPGGGQTATQQGGALKCPVGEVASLWGCVKGPVPNCPPGVLHQVTPDRRVLCDTAQAPQPNPNPPPLPPVNKAGPQNAGPKICAAGEVANNCTCPAGMAKDSQASGYPCKPACPAGQAWMLGICCSTKWGRDNKGCKGPPPAAPGIKCGPGMQPQGNTCVSVKKPGATTSKQIICPSNLVPQNGKCGCAPGLTWNGKVCAAKPQRPTTAPPPQQQAVPQRVNCTGGRVPNANGQCQCPPNLPRWNGSVCKKAKKSNTDKVNNFLKQLQQPQQQQQQQRRAPQPQQKQQGQQGQQLSPQQQQQLQQGLNKLNQILSDRRAKRDVVHIQTRADGLKLYSFRYLWGDSQYVGVMAQDLLDDPARAGAVSVHRSGYYQVDYEMLGLTMVTREAWRAANP